MARQQYQTRAVAAACMPDMSTGECLTHTVNLDTDQPLCKRVKATSLLDDTCATDPNAAPTCPTCAKRDPRRLS